MRRNLLHSRCLFHLVRTSLGGLFLWAGAVKLADVEAFAAVISRYGLVPDTLLAPVAYGLPAVEVLAGVGLMFEIRGSKTVVAGLLGLFLAVLWFGILHNLEIDCGCFSWDEQQEHGSLRAAFWRDWLMMAAVGYLWLWRRFHPLRQSRGH